MKRQLILTALILTALISSVFAQETGQWEYNGGFEGSTRVTWPGKLSIADSWDGSRIRSAAGQAYLKLTYKRDAWNTWMKFLVDEKISPDATFGLNWAFDMGGFTAETNLGLRTLTETNSALAALKATGLQAWMNLLDHQMEVRFAYNKLPDPNKIFVLPGPGDEWVEVALGEVGSNGAFRLWVIPAAFYGSLQFGAVMPIPLEAKSEELAFTDEFLMKTHFFAGYEAGGVELRAGYWMQPEESPLESKIAFGMAMKRFIIRDITLYDRLEVNELNHWKLEGQVPKGKVKNVVGFHGIPLPGTKGLIVSNYTNYVLSQEEFGNPLDNTIEASTVIPVGPVTIDPSASYYMSKKANEIKSSLALTYNVPGLPGSLKTQLKVSEAGIHTTKDKRPDTTITVTPLAEFYITIVPNFVGFQTDASVPIMMDLTDSTQDMTKVETQAMLMFNLGSRNISRIGWNDDWSNQFRVRYKLAYDITHNEVAPAGADLTLAFKFEW